MYHVLIVDDEPSVIHSLCRQVDWRQYNLALAGTADSGEKALAILRQRTVDILFTDVCMPRMDGLELISVAKQENPDLRVVIISAYRDFDFVKKALLMGVDNYLLKPVDQIELNRTLDKTIDHLNRERNYHAHSALDSSASRSNVLDRWVNATIQDDELHERAEALDIDLSARQYQLCVIEIQAQHTESRTLLEIEQVLGMCQDNFGAFASECFRDRLDRVVSILHGTDMVVRQGEFDALLEAVNLDAEKQGIAIFASISPVTEGIENTAEAYAHAVEYLKYRLIDPDANRIYFADLLAGFEKLGCEPAQAQLGNALALETIEKADDAIDSFFDLCGNAGLKTVKACAIPMLMSVVRLVDEAEHLSESFARMETTSLASFGDIDSIENLHLWFHGVISETFALMGIRRQLLSPLVQRTMDTIKKHFHADISLKSIALLLKVSPAYLGRLFSNEIGKSFSDYLMGVRLQASSVLLLETDLKIREILCRIGMESQSYYNRAFKKAYGVVPSEFRRQSHHGEDSAKEKARHRVAMR